MELIRLFISEDLADKSGVSAIALVDSPAIEEGWMAFLKANQDTKLKRYSIQLANQKGDFAPVGDQQLLAGALMVPNKKILRKEGDREFEVYFTPDDIKKIQEKFALSNINTSLNQMHNNSFPVAGGVVQHFIIDRKQGIMPPLGQEHLEDGTWFGYIKVKDKSKWEEYIKTGIYTGFSVEGFFYEESEKSPEATEDFSELEQLIDYLISEGYEVVT